MEGSYNHLGLQQEDPLIQIKMIQGFKTHAIKEFGLVIKVNKPKWWLLETLNLKFRRNVKR